MEKSTAYRGGHRALTLAVCAAALALVATCAAAQNQGPPPGPPPPGPGGILAQLGPPPGPILTPAQKTVAALPPPMPGGMPPVPPPDPNGPRPAADPRDFEGTWFHNQPLEFRAQKDMYGAWAPFNEAGAKILSRRVMALKNGTPFINASAKCRPVGPQWQRDLNMAFQITQSKTLVEFIFGEYHGRWNITLDAHKMPLPTQKEYMGHSVGHWDGSTLVVDTSDFKQGLWLDTDGTPLSTNGKLITRMRKVDNGKDFPFLEMVTTIDDPAYYTKPWSIVRTFGWDPGQALFNEYNCEEQIGDPSDTTDAGLVPEPKD